MTKDLLPTEHYVVATGIPQGCSDGSVESHFDKQWHGGCGDVVRVVRPYGGKDPAVALVMFHNAETADKVVTFGDRTIGGVKVKVEKLSEPFVEFTATVNKKRVHWDAQVTDYLNDQLGLKVKETDDVIRGSYWQVSEAKKYLSNPASTGAGEDANTPTASPRKKKTLVEKFKPPQLASGNADENPAGGAKLPGFQVGKTGNGTQDGRNETGKNDDVRNRTVSTDGDTDEFEDALEESKNGSESYKRQSSSDGAGATSAAGGATKASNDGGTKGQRGTDTLVDVYQQNRNSSSGQTFGSGANTGGDGGSSDRRHKNSSNLGTGGDRSSGPTSFVSSHSGATGGAGAYSNARGGNGARDSLAKDDNFGHGSFRNAGGDPLASLQIPSTSRQRGPNQAQAKHAQVLSDGNKKIVIYQADITNVDVNVIVSPVGSTLDHAGGAANAIFEAAGKKYRAEIDAEQKKMTSTWKYLGSQDVFFTFGFDLGYSFIFHVKSPFIKTELKTAIEAVLREADKDDGITSIAIPAIGAGQGSIRANEAAPIIVQTAVDFRCRNLKEIHLVDFNANTVTALKWAATDIEQRLKQNRN